MVIRVVGAAVPGQRAPAGPALPLPAAHLPGRTRGLLTGTSGLRPDDDLNEVRGGPSQGNRPVIRTRNRIALPSPRPAHRAFLTVGCPSPPCSARHSDDRDRSSTTIAAACHGRTREHPGRDPGRESTPGAVCPVSSTGQTAGIEVRPLDAPADRAGAHAIQLGGQPDAGKAGAAGAELGGAAGRCRACTLTRSATACALAASGHHGLAGQPHAVRAAGSRSWADAPGHRLCLAGARAGAAGRG
jgi:hypothetical protein